LQTSKTLSAAGILQVRRLAEFTVSYLESLSTGELLVLADKNGLDIPDGLERGFIIEELFYIDYDAEDSGADPIHHHEQSAESGRIAALPQQYHISFVEVLIRDPLWVFVFWEVKAQDPDTRQEHGDSSRYCLKVTPLGEDNLLPNTAASFVVTIDSNDCSRYLGFLPEDGRCFKVALCTADDEQTVLAESRPFRLPQLIKPKDELVQALYRNPLSQLSGINRFSLVRSENRLIRSEEPEG